MSSTLAPKRSRAFSAPLFIAAAVLFAGLYSWFYSRGIPWIHDEASYLFQAKTFLLGRLVNPVHPAYLFFDQYHVINEGIYASKYFPGYGLTLLPFAAAGIPYLNPVFFYGLQLALVFLIAREIFGIQTAKIAVVLTAFSPQIFLQTAFLLNHIAGAVFCLLFFLGFIKWRENGSLGWLWAGGLAWAAAFLIRPLTALGFGFPVAVAILLDLKKKPASSAARDLFFWLLPVCAAAGLLCFYNHAVTGNWLKTPFDFYAEIHAPFHRYGFNTWVRYAQEALGPRVDPFFNELYHNHTFGAGLIFLGLRLAVFIKFLVGSETLGLALLLCWVLRLRQPGFYHKLIFCVWLSLQLVHLPHWFPGILLFGANYLYEASALVIIGIAESLLAFSRNSAFQKHSKDWMKGFLLLWILFSLVTIQNLGENIRKNKFPVEWLQQKLAKDRVKKAVVFVRYEAEHDSSHDFNYNDPSLDGALILARDRGAENERLKAYFPGYEFYLWDFMEQKLEKI